MTENITQPAVVEEPAPEGGDSVVVISKADFLVALEGIRHILSEYGMLIDNMADTEDWRQEAVNLVKTHQTLQENGASPLGKIHLVIGLFQFLVSRVNQQEFNFKVPTLVGVIPEHENENLAEFSNHLKFLQTPIEKLVGEIREMANSGEALQNERLQSLLMAIASFFKAIIRQDWEDVSLVLNHINLVTTTRDSHNLVKQIAKIARNIYNSLNEFSQFFTVENLAHSTEEIPDAVKKLNSVIERLETAANTNLDCLEKLNDQHNENLQWLKESQEAVADCESKLEQMKADDPGLAGELEGIQESLREGIGSDLGLLRQRAEDSGRTFLDLISNQSFQDLTGQTLKKVINFIETLQFKMIELLPNYKKSDETGAAEAADKGSVEKSPQETEQNQEQVDQLLADLGF